MKTALADQQSAISSLVKKDIDLNTTSKLAYAHSLAEDKYSLGAGVISGAATCRPGPQSYAYSNGHAEPGAAASAAVALRNRSLNDTTEEEEQCNDVPALKNQYQVSFCTFL